MEAKAIERAHWRVFLVASVCLCMLRFIPVSLRAQTQNSGLVAGQVFDPSGAAVPGAKVTLVRTATGGTLVATTDASGHYVFPSVATGIYNLRASAAGFQVAVITGLQVEILKSSNVNVTLKVGQTSQTVTVTATSQMQLETANATVGTVLNTTALENLPQLSRSTTALMYLQPGVAPNTGDANHGGQVSGSRADQNTFNLDGGDATDQMAGTNSYAAPEGSVSAVIPTPIETTEEFRVATSGSNATFNTSSGAQVAIETKRGTNQYHGEAYEYHTDDGLDANTWRNNALGIHKPHSVDNRFGVNGGGPLPFLKNRAWFFLAYEGHRFYDNSGVTVLVPTATLRQGIIQFKNSAGQIQSYSLAPGGVSSNCGPSGASLCDPRNLGESPAIASEFALYPKGNDPSFGDGLNTIGYGFVLPTPAVQDIAVSRFDLKLNSKWSMFTTYHWSRLSRVATTELDIVSPTPTSVSNNPIQPGMVTLSVTGNLTPTFTAVTHGSFLRNEWQFARTFPSPFAAGANQLLELAGEQAGNGTANNANKVLSDPINIDTQDARQRNWNGHDWYIAEDMSLVSGSNLFQFGASGEILHDEDIRDDDVIGGLTNGPTDLVEVQGNGSGEFATIGSAAAPLICAGSLTTNCIPSPDSLRYNELAASLLGVVDRATQVATRTGQFQANPLGTGLVGQGTVPAFQLYFQDVKQLKPSITVTAGLSWGVQLPPSPVGGKAVLWTGPDGGPLNYVNYIDERAYSLQQNGVTVTNGVANAYNPPLSLTPINYLPGNFKGNFLQADWHAFSPRVSVAWNIPYKNWLFGHNHQTAFRAGYSIFYDRNASISEIAAPLITGGLSQVDACGGPVPNGSGGVNCTNNTTNLSNAFRIGVDGNSVPIPTPATLPIPYTPPNNLGLFLSWPFDYWRVPGHSHDISVSLQRALPNNMLLEVGYIGKFGRNLPEGIAVNAPDYLMKDAKSGQTYAQAFDGVAQALRTGAAVPDEPFFDNLIGLPTCTAAGFANCSLMVAKQDPTDLRNGNLNSFDFDEFARASSTAAQIENTQVFEFSGTDSEGWSNYNGAYVALQKGFSNSSAFRGLQFQFNWTWSHALGIQGQNELNIYSANSPYNNRLDYSSAQFDRRHVINLWWTYTLPFGNGKDSEFNLHNPVLNAVAGNWIFSGIYTFATGLPTCVSADGNYGSFLSNGTCAISSFNLNTVGGTVLDNVKGSGGIGTSTLGVNMFSNPQEVYSSLSRPLLSQYGQVAFGSLRTPLNWNVDIRLAKVIPVHENYNLQVTADFLNAFNHVNFGFPSLDLNSPASFGSFSTQLNTPRQIQFGAQFTF